MRFPESSIASPSPPELSMLSTTTRAPIARAITMTTSAPIIPRTILVVPFTLFLRNVAFIEMLELGKAHAEQAHRSKDPWELILLELPAFEGCGGLPAAGG